LREKTSTCFSIFKYLKSTFSRSVVVNDLDVHEDAPVIYFYCQYNDQVSTTEILACMLKQMVERSQEAAQYVSASLYKKCQRLDTKPSKSELLTTLRGAAQQIDNLFIVVDALDELKDDVRPEVVRYLASLQQSLFMTSRPLSDLPLLKGPDLHIWAPDDDFLTHISKKISCFPKLDRLLSPSEVRDEIVAKIHNGCKGM
jgi:hypothetical protein